MKKTLSVSVVCYLLLIPSFFLFAHNTTAATGDTFTPIAPITGLTDVTTATNVIKNGDFAVFFNNIYKFLVGMAAVLAVIEIIWGGLEISTKDSVSKQLAGKDRIRTALFGLVLVLSPVIVFSIINPSILNFSVSFKKIDMDFTSNNASNNAAENSTSGYSVGTVIFNQNGAFGSSGQTTNAKISGMWCYLRGSSSLPDDPGSGKVCSTSEDSCKENMKNERFYEVLSACGLEK